MKELYLTLILVVTASVTFAQLKVVNSGKVGIDVGTDTPISSLGIGTIGDEDSKVVVAGGTKKYALKITNSGAMSDYYGIYSTVSACGNYPKAIAIQGEGAYYSSMCPGMGIGIRGLSGGGVATSRGFGVSGLAFGVAGAGVYGSAGSTEDLAFSGIYAGYFNGNSIVTNGVLTATVVPPSDARLKEQVRTLEKRETINKLLQLNPVEYRLKQIYIERDSTDQNGAKVSYTAQRYDESKPFFTQKRYGLIAQEVQKIYPDLVYESSDGYLGIDYTGLIPILIESIQELKSELDVMRTITPEMQSAPQKTLDNEYNAVSKLYNTAALFQNSPNPFSQSTQIKYQLPEEVNQALLCIYDMNGKQLKQILLHERGEGSVTLHGSELSAGIYLYALIADGKEVDVKRMILTE